MTASFDPYLKWLGIPPKHQPPNAYRLLGIELFESDGDVIANAADQRMAHLKNFAVGEHSNTSQKILNEIAAARVRLLNSEQKTKYDRVLREHLEEQKRPAVRKAALAKPRAVAEVVPVAPVVPVIDTGVTASPRPVAAEAESKQRPPWLLPAAVGGGVLVVIILVLASVMGGGGGDDEVAGANDSSSGTPNEDAVPGVPPTDDADDDHVLPVKPPKEDPPIAKVPREDPKATLVLDWPEDERSDVRVLIDDAVVSIPATGKVEHSLSPGMHKVVISRPGYETVTSRVTLRSGERRLYQPKWELTQVAVVPNPPQDKPPEDPPGDSNPPPDPPVAKKLPPPDPDTKRGKVKEIREIYRDEFAGATDGAKKAALARQLSSTGEDTKGNPVDRFVLFEMAIDLATEAGDLSRALAIIDRIDQLYAVDGMGMKAAALSTVAKKILTRPGSSAMDQEIVLLAGELQAEALSRGDVASAGKFVRIAIPAARKLKDKRLLAQLQESLDELDGLQKRYDLAQKAVEALERTPDHPKANEVAGAWYCFIAGDWNKGLPWLAKAEDTALAALAKQDLAGPTKPAEQVAMGDQWYEIADKRKGLESSRLEARASYWYKQALPNLAGLEARRLEKRLSEMGVSMGDYALKFDGQKSYVLVPNFPIGLNIPITVEALVKPAPPPVGVRRSSSTQAILSNVNVPGKAGLSLDRYSSSGWAFRFYYLSGSSTYGYSTQAYSYGSSRTDKWYHVAGVFDGRQIRLYVDGQLKDTNTVTGMHNPSRLQFMVGAAPSGSSSAQGIGVADPFSGQIKAVRVSKAVVYTTSFAPPVELTNQGTSTVLLFRLDEGSGSRAKNAKGGKAHGEIHDAEWVKVESTPTATPPPTTGRVPSRPTPPRTTPPRTIPSRTTPPPPTDPSQPLPSFEHLPRKSPPAE
ncbi:MAG: hypothetical protein HQ567_34370 [Candidatus Nealsonbacteria bacterium]|nr:hypothetical protein [Candidatus Nealsonbacteria bacterium]